MAVSAASSSSSASLLDWFKPLRSEAIARLRTNTVGLVGLVILSNLLPVPSPWRAFDVVWQRRPTSAPYYYLCAAEIALLAVLLFNVVQASYALKYPRVPPPPPPSPARKAKDTPLSPARQWRLSSSTTPNSSPQRQKAFSSYAPSPVSTPSRIVNYTIPGSVASPPDASFASSMSVPGSPASPLAAYRGRHSASVGRAFDGSLLSRLAKDDDEDEDYA
ncbi:uncharacterized protein TRAVEDRAFT_133127 [Trametes versicolor FP-101664 SS1]|uniref:uncharacterized protein n=1 Tax=Trametes versicolor (strain FP-101664) TaxID=717944 RepID=UPI00046215B5|nr:uncharacterized protein TRAVEDRAFT_133127 [Trametes versicolor FP-101664 SS1]EIW53651.1 hypothetical protein TRAVEDRAFT_133127 [Trametes versicolor FP-101664 SS1]